MKINRHTISKLLVAGLFCFCIACSDSSNQTTLTLFPVSSDGVKWGYINLKGEYAINPQFEDADYFSDGLAKIKSGGKTGYVNMKGEFVIPATYKSGTAFSNGLAFVVAEGGAPTCIDKGGNTKFTMNAAKYITAFSENLAIFVTESGEYGFVDKTGSIVINAQFERASPFCGGFARIWQKGNAGFIDKTGKIVVNPQQFKEVENFSEGKAAFYNGSNWGYIDEKGAYAINPMFEGAGQFKNGLAPIRQGNSFGYIDPSGKLLINPQFDEASPFSEGLAAVRSAGKFGYIKKDGKYEINPQFESAGEFHNGITMVRSADKWGFINKKGQYVVNPQLAHVKIENPERTQHYFIENDFYDTSEFIRLFFDREKGNAFDGVSASTTLEKLAEHPVYGTNLNARADNYADSRQTIPVTKDISIGNVLFFFNTNSIYQYDEWGHKTGLNFDATPDAVMYRLQFSGKAYEKRHVIINALRSEIERRHGQPMARNLFGEIEREYFHLLQDDGKLSFAIVEDNFSVAFKKEYFSGNRGEY